MNVSNDALRYKLKPQRHSEKIIVDTKTMEIASLSLLVAVDGSDHSGAAVRWVASLRAARRAVRCVLLNVKKPLMAGEVGAILPASIAMAERTQRANDILDAAASVLRAGGFELNVKQKTDEDVATAVLPCARDHKCDVIVLGRRGQGALRAALLGSVSASVVRQATLPVMVINDSVSPLSTGPLRILVACDGSAPSSRAAAAAAQVARCADAGGVQLMHVRPDLTVVGAIFGPRDRLLEHWSGADWEQGLAEARTILEKAGCTYTVHPVFGDHPGEQILQMADRLGCGMIAMGTRGFGPVSQVLLGSVAQHVVERARVAVLLSR